MDDENEVDPIVAEVNTDKFHAVSEMKRVFIPTGEKTKKGKDKLFPIFIRSIKVDCKRSGSSFKFPCQSRAGIISFGDSRQNDKSFGGLKTRYGIEQMTAELARMVGADNASVLVGALV